MQGLLVEAAFARAFPDLADTSVVVASPDPRWGEAVTLVVAGADPPELAHVRAVLRAELPSTALPTRVARIEAIPLLGPGKPDRRTVRERISARRRV